MRGIQALFVRRDEVEAAWTWVDSIIDARAADNEAPKPYQAGTGAGRLCRHDHARRPFPNEFE